MNLDTAVDELDTVIYTRSFYDSAVDAHIIVIVSVPVQYSAVYPCAPCTIQRLTAIITWNFIRDKTARRRIQVHASVQMLVIKLAG